MRHVTIGLALMLVATVVIGVPLFVEAPFTLVNGGFLALTAAGIVFLAVGLLGATSAPDRQQERGLALLVIFGAMPDPVLIGLAHALSVLHVNVDLTVPMALVALVDATAYALLAHLLTRLGQRGGGFVVAAAICAGVAALARLAVDFFGLPSPAGVIVGGLALASYLALFAILIAQTTKKPRQT